MVSDVAGVTVFAPTVTLELILAVKTLPASVAVIVRSERLVGKTLQGRYDAKTDKFEQGQGPTQVPFELA